MTDTKFTKGPWQWEYDEDTGWHIADVIMPQFGVEDGTPAGGYIDKANAHLIAAAPSLYEALEQAIAELEMCCFELSNEDYNNPEFNAVLALARGEVK